MKNNSAHQKNGLVLSLFLIIGGIILGLGIVILPARIWISLVIGIFVLFFGIYKPMLLVILLLSICPFGKLWEPGGISIYELVYSLSFLLILVLSVVRRFLNTVFIDSKRDFATPITYPLLSLFLISLASAVISAIKGIPFVGWASDLNMILFYGLYFVVLYNFKTAKSVKIVFLFLATALCLSMILFRIPVTRNSAVVVPRWGTFAASVYNLTVFFPVLSLALVSKGRVKKIVYILVTAFLAIGIVLTFGRSRWLGLFGGMAFLSIFLPLFSKSRLLRFFFVGVVAVIVYILVCINFPSEHYVTKLPSLVWERLGSITRVQTEPPVVSRLSESAALMKKVRAHPFMGNGLGATVTFTRRDYPMPFVETTRYIHNSYLFFLFKLGILGFFAFLWLCIAFVIYGIKVFQRLPEGIYKAIALGFMSSFVATLIASIAAPDLTSPIFSIYAGFLFGAVAVIDKTAGKTK